VQGFGSGYPRTWEKEVSDSNGTQKSVMWLQDFLPKELPRARILAFDYPSQWFGDPDYTNLKICGRALMEEIRKVAKVGVLLMLILFTFY